MPGYLEFFNPLNKQILGSVLGRLMWVGPQTDLAIQQEFDMLFQRSNEIDGDALFCASPELVKADVAHRLQKRGQLFKEEHFPVTKELLYAMLPPGAVQRLNAYEAQRASKEGIDTGAYIVDANQWPETGCSSAGPFWPCQLTHQTTISCNHCRCAVGLEYLLGQGFPVFPEIHGGKQAAVVPILKDWPSDKIVSLSGNSMSLPAMGAWMAYVLCNIQPAEKVPRPMSIQPETNMLLKGASADFSSPILKTKSPVEAAETLLDEDEACSSQRPFNSPGPSMLVAAVPASWEAGDVGFPAESHEDLEDSQPPPWDVES